MAVAKPRTETAWLAAEVPAEMFELIEWRPGLGDPTVMGWVTVLAYFVTTWLCLRAFMAEKAGKRRPYREAVPALLRVIRRHWPKVPSPARRAALWLFLAAILAALGVNKQLDLQSLVTDVGRVLAYEQGWYAQRKTVQLAFIIGVGVSGLFGLGMVAWLSRGMLADFRLPLGGLVVLGSFVLARASSFHNVDILIHTTVGGIELNWVFELGGIGLIAGGALRKIRAASPG